MFIFTKLGAYRSMNRYYRILYTVYVFVVNRRFRKICRFTKDTLEKSLKSLGYTLSKLPRAPGFLCALARGVYGGDGQRAHLQRFDTQDGI